MQASIDTQTERLRAIAVERRVLCWHHQQLASEHFTFSAPINNCAAHCPAPLAFMGFFFVLDMFRAGLKFLVVSVLVIAFLVFLGNWNDQSASSSISNPVTDMTAADVVAFFREQGLESLADKVPDDMDGRALLEFVKWHDEMPVGARAKSEDDNEYWNQLSRAVKMLSMRPPKTFWEWHSHNVRLSEMW